MSIKFAFTGFILWFAHRKLFLDREKKKNKNQNWDDDSLPTFVPPPSSHSALRSFVKIQFHWIRPHTTCALGELAACGKFAKITPNTQFSQVNSFTTPDTDTMTVRTKQNKGTEAKKQQNQKLRITREKKFNCEAIECAFQRIKSESISTAHSQWDTKTNFIVSAPWVRNKWQTKQILGHRKKNLYTVGCLAFVRGTHCERTFAYVGNSIRQNCFTVCIICCTLWPTLIKL